MMADAAAVEIFVERARARADHGDDASTARGTGGARTRNQGRAPSDTSSAAIVEGRPLSQWRAEARQFLGLPDAPVFAAGHQATAWHPGIVAKTFWTDATARTHGASAVHLVVDQDAFDGCFVEWPELKDGFWTAKGHRFAPAAANAAALTLPAFLPRAADASDDAPEMVRKGLHHLSQLLAARADAANAALQVTLAQLDGLAPWIAMPRVVCASQLTGTSLGRRLVERMLEDPQACAESFNAALRLHPHAARPLRVQGAQSELPLWLLDETGARVRATADGVRAALAAGRPLLPRAFLLGVLARTALADRFTHGLGGQVYEDVSDEWMQQWLGWRAPAFDVVSATLCLPLEVRELPRQKSYRAAWCDPDLTAVAGAGPSTRRRKFLDDIAALPRRSPQRRRLFEALVADRQTRRAELAPVLRQLQQSEQALQRSSQSKALARRRSWCALLHAPDALSQLRQQLFAQVGAGT
jgi:hypothetical protein